MKTEISTPKAPEAIGPYSQGIESGNFLFISGQIPVNPQTGNIEEENDIIRQTVRVLENLKNILDAAGSDMSKVVKTTVFIKNMDDFPVINDIYSKYFDKPYPARSCVEVSKLPKGVLIEIEAVAHKNIATAK